MPVRWVHLVLSHARVLDRRVRHVSSGAAARETLAEHTYLVEVLLLLLLLLLLLRLALNWYARLHACGVDLLVEDLEELLSLVLFLFDRSVRQPGYDLPVLEVLVEATRDA